MIILGKFIKIKETIFRANDCKRRIHGVNLTLPFYYGNQLLIGFDTLLEKPNCYSKYLDDDFYNKAIHYSIRNGIYISLLDFDLINDKNNSKNPQDNEFIEICINGLVKKHLKFKKELIPKIDFNKNVDYGIKVKNGEIVYGLRYGGPEPGLNTKFLEFRDVDKRKIYSIKNPMNQIIRDLLKECIIWE